jgi:preprotein translocase subunit SecF
MRYRKVALAISGVVVLVSLIILPTKGLNLGIEFSGGTELQVKYVDTPNLGQIRSTLADAGLGRAVVTTIGDPADNEIYVRLGAVEGAEGDSTDDLISTVVMALRGDSGEAKPDLNVIDQGVLRTVLGEAPGLEPASAESLAAEILELRKETAIFHSLDELGNLPGMSAGVLDHLRQETSQGPIALRSQSYIGPSIGEELKRNSGRAILGSLIGMLIYIWIRFQLQWGFAAVIALAHDTLVTLGLFSLFGKEMSLPVVAAFLTLVGYSANDTVVVFDRIRENLRTQPGKTLESVINLSINQTLSRTIITSGLTLVVVLGLLLFGGPALNPFAFVLTAGVIVGTYSSIFVASPVLLWAKRMWDRRKQKTEAAAPAPAPRRAKKVRSSTT